MACDEWVVARTGLPKVYARCLAHAAEVQGASGAVRRLIPALFNGSGTISCAVSIVCLTIKGKTRRNVSLVGAAAAMFAMAMISAQLQGVRFAEIADIVLPHVAGPDRCLQRNDDGRWKRCRSRSGCGSDIAPSDALQPDAPVGTRCTCRHHRCTDVHSRRTYRT